MSVHRALVLRNWILGLSYPECDVMVPPADVERCWVSRAGDGRDAVLVRPHNRAVSAAVLLLHGIGETVEHWGAVQQMFAAQGVASLVVDYAGFGRSPGWFSTDGAERDAWAAYEMLRRRFPTLRISLVGFSLGSGIAAAIYERTGADLLVLCAAYPSLRRAARSIGLPKIFRLLMPDAWRTEEMLRGCRLPVLIVHGELDRLFPCTLARDLAAKSSSPCELMVIPGVSHDDPIFRPSLLFWGPVLRRVGGEVDGGRAMLRLGNAGASFRKGTAQKPGR